MNRSRNIKERISALLEKAMPLSVAMKVFGIAPDSLSDKALIKKIYRSLSLKHHPDRGGSTEKQAEINNAFEVLAAYDGTAKNTDNFQEPKRETEKQRREREAKQEQEREAKQARQEQRQERQAKREKQAESIIQDLLSRFKLDDFIKHFSTISGVRYSGEIIKIRRFSGFDAEFSSPDNKNVFSLFVNAKTYTMNDAPLGGKLTYKMVMEATGLIDNRKIQITKKTWQFSNEYNMITDPEKMFPKAKIKKIVFNKKDKRKIKRRDVILAISKKYNGRVFGKDMWLIPIGNEGFSIVMSRRVFSGKAIWSLVGIYFTDSKSKSKLALRVQSAKIFGNIAEDETLFEFWDLLNAKAKNMKEKQIVEFISKEFKKFTLKNESIASKLSTKLNNILEVVKNEQK